MIIVKFAPSTIVISKKENFSSSATTLMAANPVFSGIMEAVNEWATTGTDLGKAEKKAENGTVADTKAMYVLATTWNDQGRIVASSVDNLCSGLDYDSAVALASSAGFATRAKRKTNLPDLRARAGLSPLSFIANRKAVRKPRSGYKWKLNEDKKTEIVDLGTTIVANILVQDLKEFTKYWITCALVQGSTTLPFCDPVSFITGKKEE